MPNPGSATFCWRCFYPFETHKLHASAVTPGVPPSSSPYRSLSFSTLPQNIPAAKKPFVRYALVAIVAALVALAGGKAVMDRLTRKHIHIPDAIAGAQQVEAPALARSVESLEHIAAQNGTTGKAAFYGDAGTPRFFVAAFEHRLEGGETPDSVFAAFADGFQRGGAARIDLNSKTTDATGEATFVCARVMGVPPGSLCMWTDHDIVGFVGSFGQGIGATHDLTTVVRTSVEA